MAKPKKAKKEKAPKPMRVPEQARAQIRVGQEKVNDLSTNVANYIAGVRAAMGVPDGWTYDAKEMVFRPPAAKKGK